MKNAATESSKIDTCFEERTDSYGKWFLGIAIGIVLVVAGGVCPPLHLLLYLLRPSGFSKTLLPRYWPRGEVDSWHPGDCAGRRNENYSRN